MSQFPNGFNPQAFYGQTRPNMNMNTNGNATGSPNPNMNTPSPMMGSIRPSALQNFNSPTASPTPNRPHQFNASQLATLTDFHQRQQALLAVQQAQQQARTQAQASGQIAPVGQGQPRPNLQAMQQVLAQRLQAQQQQNAFQQFLLNNNQSQSITPSQLQTQPGNLPLPLGHQTITPTTIAPQQTLQQQSSSPIPPIRPISQNPAFNPALLNAAKIAQNTISNANLNLNLNPTSSSSPQLSNFTTNATIPLTQTFTPAAHTIRPPSPVKSDSKVSSDKKEKAKDEAGDAKEGKKAEKEVEKEKKKKAARKKKEKKDNETEKDKEKDKSDKDKSDKDKDKADLEKEKDQDTDKGKDKDDSNAATPTEKPVKPKKPRTEEEKAKRAEARRRKIAADREKAAAAAAATAQVGEGDAGVFSASAATSTNKDSAASAEVKDAKKDEVSKDKDKDQDTAKGTEVKAVEPKAATTVTATAPEARSRRQEGMRGSMRNEIARLMYGAGDVPEPDVDTVDYMEDMVVEFLADLCRPIPPLRPTPTSQPLPVPLSFEVVRHRLTSPSYSKYLERFDHMVYMSEILKQHRRIANPNLNDLVETVGNDYLGLEDEDKNQGLKRSNGGDNDARNRKRGRPNAGGGGGMIGSNGRILKDKSEKRKPGPQKGWKLNRDPNTPLNKRSNNNLSSSGQLGQKRKYQRKPGQQTPGSGPGVKREGSMNI